MRRKRYVKKERKPKDAGKKPSNERKDLTFTGTLEREDELCFVRMHMRDRERKVYIPADKTKGAEPKQVVLFKVWRFKGRIYGEVLRIVGNEGERDIDVRTVAAKLNMPYEFTPKTLAQAADAPGTVRDADIEGREDLRGQPAITIDGADAKDLDDAVYLERRGDGFRLFVHIADVAHYVPRGTAMDKEAYARGTSAYLADRVIPMLPRELSNGICSLNAGVDRLALSCMIDMDKNGEVVGSKIMETVIRVRERMTYDGVLEMLTKDNNPENPMLADMARLCGILKERRRRRGAIELSTSESQFIMDDNGHPIDIIRREQSLATSIIEEFMILCNETVAATMEKIAPFMYRVHPSMDKKKLDALFGLFKALGLKSGTSHKKKDKKLQDLLKYAEGTHCADIINRAALGSMQQALYSGDNIGHFGLASECYCHFTSPIRRYPDLYCHRVVKAHLRGGLSAAFKGELKKNIDAAAHHLSVAERRAVEAERSIDALKKAEYMSDKIGQISTGRITGVQAWGFYVELPNTVEGLVSMASLEDDFYILDAENYRLVGERRRKTYRLGDKVRVMLVGVDIQRRHVNFAVVRSKD